MTSYRDWIPVVRSDVSCDRSLSDQATEVASLIDGRTSVEQISASVGIEADDMLTVLALLVSRGAVPSEGAPAEVLQLAQVHSRMAARASPIPPPLTKAEPKLEVPRISDLPEYDTFGNETPSADSADTTGSSHAFLDVQLDDTPSDDSVLDSHTDMPSLRKIFETVLRPLPRDARVEMARTASGNLLLAFCLDPETAVVQSVLDNPLAALPHARLVAEYHRTAMGLDAIGRRSELARDSTVRRFLLRNPQSSERLLTRILGPLTLPQVFRINIGHELTERSRKVGRTVFRQSFDRASSEEKVAFIVQTEGRCLPILTGQTLDQKTTALLCRRTYQSTLLIQSIARFPAAPPALLSHLLRQPIVQRNQHLKRLVLQHKNCPKLMGR